MRRAGLIPAIAAFAIAIYWNATFLYARYGFSLWWLSLLNLLPGLMLVGAYRVVEKMRPVSWSFRPIVGLVIRLVGLSVLLVFVVVCLWGFNRFARDTTPVTRASCYESLLRENHSAQENWVSHFPTQLPTSARNVRLYYRPAFLMGGGSFELRFEASAGDVHAVLRHFRSLSKNARSVKSDSDKTNSPVSYEFRNTSNREWSPLPDDFRIFVMNGPRYYPGGGDSPADRGVAVSERRNEIIYWAGF